MRSRNHEPGWNPYLAGALAGLLSTASVGIAGKYFGTSTTYANTAGMLLSLVIPERVAALEYYRLEMAGFDWQWLFVAGILVGSLLAALTSGSFRWQAVPDMWQARFGPAIFPRAAAAFGGGFLAIIGARLAGGCPSGHGISGVLQLAVGSLISLVCFFAGGLVVAWLLYRGGRS